jgi:hypothetical protein
MRVFLSYRRDDAAGHAGRIADHLVARYGPDAVFMDVETIEAGPAAHRASVATLSRACTQWVEPGR